MWKSMGMNHRQTHIDAQTNKRTKQNPKLSLSLPPCFHAQKMVSPANNRDIQYYVCVLMVSMSVCACARVAALKYIRSRLSVAQISPISTTRATTSPPQPTTHLLETHNVQIRDCVLSSSGEWCAAGPAPRQSSPPSPMVPQARSHRHLFREDRRVP